MANKYCIVLYCIVLRNKMIKTSLFKKINGSFSPFIRTDTGVLFSNVPMTYRARRLFLWIGDIAHPALNKKQDSP